MSREKVTPCIVAREFPANARHNRVTGFSFWWQGKERVFWFKNLRFPRRGSKAELPIERQIYGLDIRTTRGNSDIRTVFIRLESGNDFSAEAIRITYFHEGDN